MADCRYCGKPAGVFRKAHSECAQKANKAVKQIEVLPEKFLLSKMDGTNYSARIELIAKQVGISIVEKRTAINTGLGNLINASLADDFLTEEEESKIIDYVNCFDIDLQGEFPKLANQVVKACIIRDLSNGIVSQRVSGIEQLGIKLQKTESVIWVFNDVKYWEQKVRTQYVGGSTGVSFRVAKGVYLRAGSHKGERIQTKEMNCVDSGEMVITNKHVYYIGQNKSFRIAMAKIVSVKNYSDGVEITKEAANPKPQLFEVDDPWFAANLVNQL